ncbi:hypothetical protein B0H10DRAFT_2225651 [Mycena sp. CBHHK59/15]|nr:hypothetical protein B0H10DRAFT_2225651 [Mycena sp. CBHHK59/15]
MTSAEFSSCKAAFLAALKKSREMEEYESPTHKRLHQLAELSTEAARLIPFKSQILAQPNVELAEGMFHGRDSYNNLVNPDKLPNAKFPAEYDVFKNWVRSILEKHEEKKAKPKKQTRASAKSKDATGPAAGDESDAECKNFNSPSAAYAAAFSVIDRVLAGVSQMAVDDDPAAKLRFKKKAKDTSNTSQVTSETPKQSSSKLHKSGSSKRARTDSTPFNEEAFLASHIQPSKFGAHHFQSFPEVSYASFVMCASTRPQ